MIEPKIMRQTDYMSIFKTFRSEIEELSDVKSLTQVRTGAEVAGRSLAWQ